LTIALAILVALSLLCAVVPAALFCVNLRDYAVPALPAPGQTLPAVSILIPARNEAAGIADAVHAALSTIGITFEVVVMDDSSTDGTAEIVQAIAAHDRRVHVETAPPLPPGWNGKQHACWALAQAARNPLLCFVDADVRLAPECIARMAAQLERNQASLISGFPRQVTVTFLEWLLLPLIHFVLLGFLPIARMRASTDPAFAAGCGQFLLARAADYFTCGGHTGIKLTMHDGLRLPRLFREYGFQTDLADITNFATCRMYHNAREVWSGLAKNATEGIANPRRIGPVSIILTLGQVVQFLLAAVAISLTAFVMTILAGCVNGCSTNFVTLPLVDKVLAVGIVLSVIAAWLPRWLAVPRFQQDWRSALLHPLGIVILLCIQWYALLRKLRRSPVSWRGRAYGENLPGL
jgi:glycosyltransferase involved in cell wall biosynthesis